LEKQTYHQKPQATMSASELTPLTAGGEKIRITFNIEKLRAFGLLAGMVMLIVGRQVSLWFNQFPVSDEPMRSAWDIIFHGAESNFHKKETYIFYLFNFIHTCVWIDNNPSKTMAALFLMIAMVPLSLFVFLHHIRLKLQPGPEYDFLKTVSKPLTIFQILAYMYFFLCLVNSPIQDPDLFGDWRGKRAFILHYVPYMIFQLALLLMSLEQIAFLLKREGRLPFGLDGKKGLIRFYLYFNWALYIVYCMFIWSFIFFGPDGGLWDTKTDLGQSATKFIMLAFDFCSAIVPAICAIGELKTTRSMVIEFSMGGFAV
jgi:hypothetical protein